MTSRVTASSAPTTTSCAAHTRLYRAGRLITEGFPVEQISDHLADPQSVVWLDLLEPDAGDLVVITEELGLHPLAIEDAVHDRQRPKVDVYDDHLFLTCYLVGYRSGEPLDVAEVAAFVTDRALVTVRKSEGIDLEPVLQAWDAAGESAAQSGVAFLLHGLLDHVVDGHFAVVQDLDDGVGALEALLFSEQGGGDELQRRTFALRKALVELRRAVLPMREVVNTLLRRDLDLVSPNIAPYYQDVYDHVLRVAEWTESLRDLVGSILDTNATLQSNRLNVTVRRLTAYAALLAVTTAITGYYGQNVPYPGFGTRAGFLVSTALLVTAVVVVYALLRRRKYF